MSVYYHKKTQLKLEVISTAWPRWMITNEEKIELSHLYFRNIEVAWSNESFEIGHKRESALYSKNDEFIEEEKKRKEPG